MFAFVTCELIGARESRVTVAKIAQVRLLAGMNTFVGLQVRALRVDFVASGVFAVVDAPFLKLRVVVAAALDVRCSLHLVVHHQVAASQLLLTD